MYESFYGLREKPFSLTPDPKFLYRSETHGGAFELLSYAISRREGFVAITGDIGTGKTTLCRAILEQLDDRTFTALVLNPFVTEEELIRQILCEFGVLSRDELKRGWLATVNKQGLIDTLNDFLLSLLPLGAKALVIIDEAQNLPRRVLEQIRILSNLETDTEKLLQIVLVGQPQLDVKLRSDDLRQLAQRISIRYNLRPLDQSEVAAYIRHRLAVAGSSTAVAFSPKAVQRVHRYTSGIPRLINLVCDRALLAGFAARTTRIVPDMVDTAAESLDLRPTSLLPLTWLRRRATSVATWVGAAAAIGAIGVGMIPASTGAAQRDALDARDVVGAPATSGAAATLPTARAVLVGSFEDESHATSVTRDLQAQGLAAYRVPRRARTGATVWQVLIGPVGAHSGARDKARPR